MARRRSASRRGSPATPAWMWLLTGILIGLGLAWYLFAKGYIPQPRAEDALTAESPEPSAGAGSEEVAPRKDQDKRPQYDFFTVLPEMEVVVPEQELSERSQPQPSDAGGTSAPAGSSASYLLQVGSFRSTSDAEEMKARLALLGMVAQVQTVTVNDTTWHRVRVGPVNTARQADEMRDRLSNNGIDSLVLKAGPGTQ